MHSLVCKGAVPSMVKAASKQAGKRHPVLHFVANLSSASGALLPSPDYVSFLERAIVNVIFASEFKY